MITCGEKTTIMTEAGPMTVICTFPAVNHPHYHYDEVFFREWSICPEPPDSAHAAEVPSVGEQQGNQTQ